MVMIKVVFFFFKAPVCLGGNVQYGSNLIVYPTRSIILFIFVSNRFSFNHWKLLNLPLPNHWMESL